MGPAGLYFLMSGALLTVFPIEWPEGGYFLKTADLAGYFFKSGAGWTVFLIKWGHGRVFLNGSGLMDGISL